VLRFFYAKMRLTYSDLRAQFLRNIGKEGSTDANIIADFNLHLAQRYQMIFGRLKNYSTTTAQTAATVADQTYYHYPPGLSQIDVATVTVGDIPYPLQTIYSQYTWDLLNAIPFQASAIPQFIFPRKDDFGIWPVPQDVYTITFNYFLRDRSLTIGDYTTGTVAVTTGSTTVTGTDTTFSPAMVGRWFSVTSESNTGQGYWYRVASYTSATVIAIESAYEGATGSSLTYRIGQSPEIPEEGHITLVDGATADWYAGTRKDITTGTWFNNAFWTGDGNNSSRDVGDDKIAGGLIGLINRYGGRDDKRLIRVGPRQQSYYWQIWGSSITGS
jgi:hypothetical protein